MSLIIISTFWFVCPFLFHEESKPGNRRWPLPSDYAPSLDCPEVAEKLDRNLEAIENVPWHVDPDTHAAYVTWSILGSLSDAAPRPQQVKRLSCLTDETWCKILTAKKFDKTIKAVKKPAR